MEKKRSILKKSLLVLGLSFLCILSCFVIAKPKEAEAASSSYKEISFEYGAETKPIKVKGYYFKYKNNTIRISKKKSSGYKDTKISINGAWTNGKTIYYTKDNNAIYKYSISSKKSKKVKSLSSKIGDYGYAYITKVYKGKIYFTSAGAESMEKCTTYYYNTKSKKIKKVKNNADIVASSGKYCVCQKYIASEISVTPLTLYKITSSGKFKKVKTLTKKGWYNVKAIDGKFYYVQYSDKYSFKKATVYRIKKNGKGKKKMKTVSSSVYITPYRLKKKSCSFMDAYGNVHKYKY